MKKKEKIICLDIDGTLTPYSEFLVEEGTEFFGRKPINKNTIELTEMFGCTKDEEAHFWNDNGFARFRKYISKIPPREGVKEFIDLEHEKGYKVVALTKRTLANRKDILGTISRAYVDEWAKTYELDFDDKYYLGSKDDKIAKMDEIGSDIIFEDDTDIIKRALMRGKSVVATNTGYNQNIYGAFLRRISGDFKEASKMMEELEIQEMYKDQKIPKEEVITPRTGLASIDKPWQQNYTYRQLHSTLPEMTIYDYLYESNKDNMNGIALQYPGHKIKYKKFFKMIDETARAFVAMGVEKNDIVSIAMPNTPEGIIAFYALNKIGAVTSMLDPTAPEEKINECLKQTESKLLITFDGKSKKTDPQRVKRATKNTLVKDIIYASPVEALPAWKRALYFMKEKVNHKKEQQQLGITKNGNNISWRNFIKKSKKVKKIEKAEYVKGKTTVLMPTSGTEKQKIVMLSDDNMNQMVEQQRATADNLNRGDVMITILPIFHIFGLCSTVHMPLSYSMTASLVPNFQLDKFAKLIKDHLPKKDSKQRVHMFGVPTLFIGFNKIINQLKDVCLDAFGYIVSGGGKITEDVQKETNNNIAEHGGSAVVRIGYGSTESTAGATLTSQDIKSYDTIGYPLKDTTFKIVDVDQLIIDSETGKVDLSSIKEMSYNNEGELWISGPGVALGYLNDKVETNKTFITDENGKRWLRTGDMGIMNEDGELQYTKRTNRMFKSSGLKVNPDQIENLIGEDLVLKRYVNLAVITKIPDSYKEYTPKAHIELKEEANLNTIDMVTEYMSNLFLNRLSNHEIPTEIEFGRIPRETKINYKALEARDRGEITPELEEAGPTIKRKIRMKKI